MVDRESMRTGNHAAAKALERPRTPGNHGTKVAPHHIKVRILSPRQVGYELRWAGSGFSGFKLHLGAMLDAVKDAARRLWRWPAAILDRGCARRHSARAGRDEETALGSNKETDQEERAPAGCDLGLKSRPELTNVVIHRRSIFALNFAIW
jgi:hypothetical protein